ncbi:MAG: cytochrome c oxidase assembly protein, partial [Acidiferrobacteraceae bacterium]
MAAADRPASPAPERKRPNARLVLLLVVVIAGMAGFGYGLVPLYNIVCKLTGLNGKTGGINEKAVAAVGVDTHRWVKVEFLTSLNQNMPWEFRPMVQEEKVHPGQLASETYYVRNLTNEVMTGQAVDSLVPDDATFYFKKLECLCFKH